LTVETKDRSLKEALRKAAEIVDSIETVA